ncbi:MAG: hypothetical protein HRU06_14785 [Oceanospirillaceae bacterium]|nr:hypothetical protein [Oceanospirillaceae bacterium]
MICDGKEENHNLEKDFLSDEEGDNEKSQLKKKYYAACTKGWSGPDRDTYKKANEDAKQHKKDTGHGSGVLGGA